MRLKKRDVTSDFGYYILTVHFAITVPPPLRDYTQYKMYREKIETLATSKTEVPVTMIFDNGSDLSTTSAFLSVTEIPGIFCFNSLFSLSISLKIRTYKLFRTTKTIT